MYYEIEAKVIRYDNNLLKLQITTRKRIKIVAHYYRKQRSKLHIKSKSRMACYYITQTARDREKTKQPKNEKQTKKSGWEERLLYMLRTLVVYVIVLLSGTISVRQYHAVHQSKMKLTRATHNSQDVSAYDLRAVSPPSTRRLFYASTVFEGFLHLYLYRCTLYCLSRHFMHHKMIERPLGDKMGEASRRDA